MSELPTGWVESELGQLVDVLDSRRIPVNQKERAKREGDVPYYGATGQVGWIDEAIFDEELVLLGEDGAPFLDSRKPKAYLIDGPAWVNNHAHVLRARAATSNRFLKYALDDVDYHPHVNGTTRLKLTQAAMRWIPVALPPADEQRRIVAAIEEQFSRLDAAERAVLSTRTRLAALRAAALSSAFLGNGRRVRVADFARVGSGATPKRGRRDYYEGGTVPWVTSGQLNEPFVREPAELITELALQETSVKRWPAHTLLVAMYGEGQTRGRCSELLIEATTNQACAAIVVDESVVDRSYLKLFLVRPTRPTADSPPVEYSQT